MRDLDVRSTDLELLKEGRWFGGLPAGLQARIVDDEPRDLRPFAVRLAERFGLPYRYAAEAAGLEPEEWLRIRLSGVAERQRHDQPSRDPATVRLSQSELAGMVGLSRQRLSVLLRRLEARGLIEVGYRRIRVLCWNARLPDPGRAHT